MEVRFFLLGRAPVIEVQDLHLAGRVRGLLHIFVSASPRNHWITCCTLTLVGKGERNARVTTPPTTCAHQRVRVWSGGRRSRGRL